MTRGGTVLKAEVPELGNHLLIDLALERHDQVENLAHGRPAPLVEFLGVARRMEIDLAVFAGEAQRKPFLCLAAVFALPGLADQLFGQVVIVPAAGFRNHMGGGDGGLLREFAQCGCCRILALVDAALRHLPKKGRDHRVEVALAASPTEEDAPMRIEQGDANARPIERIRKIGQFTSGIRERWCAPPAFFRPAP